MKKASQFNRVKLTKQKISYIDKTIIDTKSALYHNPRVPIS